MHSTFQNKYHPKHCNHLSAGCKKLSSKRVLTTYCVIVVGLIISMWVKYIFTEVRPYLIDILIPHSMAQEIRISVVFFIANLYIKAFSLPLQRKKLIYLLLQKQKTNINLYILAKIKHVRNNHCNRKQNK